MYFIIYLFPPLLVPSISLPRILRNIVAYYRYYRYSYLNIYIKYLDTLVAI